MAVVADTSPIDYLVLIAQIDLLNQLYARILIPPAVLAELKHPAAPKPVRKWADNPPQWLEVLSPKSSLILAQLDLGESEAISLATEWMPTWCSLMSKLVDRRRFADASQWPAVTTRCGQVPYNCPKLLGVLWEMDNPDLQRFRCHTGHSYTAAVLLDSQNEKIEDTVWYLLGCSNNARTC